MKTKPSNEQHARQNEAACPQMPVRSSLHAGKNYDCELGVGYWRKELNSLKQIASALNCS